MPIFASFFEFCLFLVLLRDYLATYYPNFLVSCSYECIRAFSFLEIQVNKYITRNKIENYTVENIESGIKSNLEKNELGMGQVMTALRLALVGSGMGPGVMDIMALIGKEEVGRRVEKAIELIRKSIK